MGNLQTGSANNNSSDILFHFNPRFDQREIVRNARFSGSWGSEEKHGGMVLNKIRRFQLQIIVEPQHYTVLIDGSSFCHFAHRAHIGLANTLTCDGNLTLNKVSYRRAFTPQPPMPPPIIGPTAPVFPGLPVDGAGGGYPTGCIPPPYPGPAPPPIYPPTGFPPNVPHPPIVNPRLPLTTTIPGGMSLGKMVIANCKIKPRAQRFKINLQFGMSGSDVALHFNPRYDTDAVVLNSKVANSWGTEEKHPIPVGLKQRGTNVEIRFLLNPEDFHIFVNGAF